ncbi:MAG TPA: hypothetical protein VMB20_07305 [Candidatus Acidoferrum sp.]|nr:hypothetical protein [Candidatus Acidoferrum sp.]
MNNRRAHFWHVHPRMVAFPVSVVATAPPLDPHATASAWASTPVTLRWDVAHKAFASEPTTVRVSTDGTFLYVRFDATQRAGVVATQRSNDVITGGSSGGAGSVTWSSDDAVWIDIWPTGPSGFEYQFEANAAGAHNESSSENVSFAPQWESHGAVDATGYTVTMAIPLAVIHGAHAGTWRMQFIRYVRASGAIDVWSYIPEQTQPDDPERAGALVMPKLVAHAPPPRPRIAVYGLGAVASDAAGGNTSRVGADLSIPITQTSSFFATFHPDYSNVELDQQTIAPNLSPRTYNEVRPFFTQAASYYNLFQCSACPATRQLLYTPGIPTPSQGYALEGKQGPIGFAAFDAIGDARSDASAVLDYTSDDNHWQGTVQHVQADLPEVVDDANGAGVNWRNGKYLSANINYSTDAGTNVLVPSQGTAIEGGANWISQNLVVSAGVRKIGAYFNPVDGYTGHPDIAGYGLYAARQWTFAPNDALQSVALNGFVDRYAGFADGQSQSDNWLAFDILTKSAWDLRVYSGSDYWRFGTVLQPVNQASGFTLFYHAGLNNNLQNFLLAGPSATPTQLAVFQGRYGDGFLYTWYRTSTIRVGNRGTLNLTLDSTQQYLNGKAPDNIQWFNGLSYAYQLAQNSSLALGVRQVVGYPPVPNGGGNCEGRCSNVSFAYHLRWKREELYVAYGDPNALITVPQAIFKLIFYAGAEKGV